MSFNPFDIAEQQYKSTQQVEPQLEQSTMDQPTSNLSPVSSAFNVAEQIYQKKQPENWWEESVRDITRTGSRAVETIMGLPGDIASFAKTIAGNVPGGAGLSGTAIQGLLGKEGLKRAAQGPRQGSAASDTLGSIPNFGQQELQNLSEVLTGGYTTPQSEWEQKSDEVVKTFTNLMTGGGVRSGVQAATRLPQWGQAVASVGRKIGMSIAGESAKEGIKLYGGSPTQQELGKMATLFLTGLTLPRLTGEMNPENYLGTLYRERDALIPQGTMVTPTGIEHGLQNYLNNTLRYGGPTPEKTQVGHIVEQFLQRVTGRAVPMDEVIDMYRAVNRNRSAVMSATDLDKAGVRMARRYWGEVADIFNQNIEGYLGAMNPEALALHRAANSGWAALNTSNRVSNFVLNHIKGVPLKTGVATLFGGGLFYPQVAATALGGAALGSSAIGATELAVRFVRNPTLRHYYNQVIESAMRENRPGTVRAMQKLDEMYQKELNDPNSNVNLPILPFQQQK